MIKGNAERDWPTPRHDAVAMARQVQFVSNVFKFNLYLLHVTVVCISGSVLETELRDPEHPKSTSGKRGTHVGIF